MCLLGYFTENDIELLMLGVLGLVCRVLFVTRVVSESPTGDRIWNFGSRFCHNSEKVCLDPSAFSAILGVSPLNSVGVFSG